MAKRGIDKIAESMIFLSIGCGTMFSALLSLMFLLYAINYFLFGADEQTTVARAVTMGFLMLAGSIFFIIPFVWGVLSLVNRHSFMSRMGKGDTEQ